MTHHSLFEKPIHLAHLPKKYTEESFMIITAVVLFILVILLALHFFMPGNTI